MAGFNLNAIHSADPHQGVLPTSYVIHKHPQFCKNCNTTTYYTTTWARTFLKPRAGMGSRIVNLRKLDVPQYNLPVERITQAVEIIPFCHECQTISLSHLPEVPIENKAIIGGYRAPPESNAKVPKPKATVDSLLDML